jgi:hypothetical protein
MTFWAIFPIVAGVFAIFFYVAQFKLDERYKGVKIAVWAYPFAVVGAGAFAFGFHGPGVGLFTIAMIFVGVGGYIHVCLSFKVNPRLRRPHNWDDE